MSSSNFHLYNVRNTFFLLPLSVQDFRLAVEEAVEEDGEPVVEEGRMDKILSTLPQAYQLHNHILTQLDSRIQQW